MKSIVAIAMICFALSGRGEGGMSASASTSNRVSAISSVMSAGLSSALPHRTDYVISRWDGQRISAEAMRRVW